MEELILRATGDREVVKDAFESLELLISESLELKVVIIAVFLIVLVSVWTIYERVNEKGWKSLIPIYRWVAIFRGIGLNPWFSLLMLLPGFNLIMLVVFYVHLTRVFKHSYFMVLGLIFLPLVFIPIFAFSEGKCDHYQPHAKLIDEPAKPENNLGPVQKVPAKPITQKAGSIPPVVGNEINRLCVRPSTKQVATTRTSTKVKEVSNKSKATRRGKYFDMARVPRRKKAIVAKPLTEVFGKPRRTKPLPATPAEGLQHPKATRPMPGDIRMMKSNIVVVGPLQDTPRETSASPSAIARKRSVMPKMKGEK